MFPSNANTLGNWTQIVVSQSLKGKDYIYAIKIGGKEVLSMTNTRPRLFYDVKVFAGSPLFNPLEGSIRRLKIEVGEEVSSGINEGIERMTLYCSKHKSGFSLTN